MGDLSVDPIGSHLPRANHSCAVDGECPIERCGNWSHYIPRHKRVDDRGIRGETVNVDCYYHDELLDWWHRVPCKYGHISYSFRSNENEENKLSPEHYTVEGILGYSKSLSVSNTGRRGWRASVGQQGLSCCKRRNRCLAGSCRLRRPRSPRRSCHLPSPPERKGLHRRIQNSAGTFSLATKKKNKGSLWMKRILIRRIYPEMLSSLRVVWWHRSRRLWDLWSSRILSMGKRLTGHTLLSNYTLLTSGCTRHPARKISYKSLVVFDTRNDAFVRWCSLLPCSKWTEPRCSVRQGPQERSSKFGFRCLPEGGCNIPRDLEITTIQDVALSSRI